MRQVIAAALLATVPGVAQWDVPTRIELNGTTPEDRQVTGLAPPQDPTDGTSAIAVRTQLATHGTATGIGAYSITLTPAPAAYTNGLRLSFEPAAVNTGAATLNVNGLGVVPLVKFGGVPLDSADLRAGVPVQVIYDGGAFQVVNQLHPACPPGYRAVGRDVCIEDMWHDSVNFYAASVWCEQHDARLCTIGEWYRACAMPGGILSSVVAFEWVDHAANHDNYAKRMGSNSSQQIGCELGGLAVPLALTRFRCCTDR